MALLPNSRVAKNEEAAAAISRREINDSHYKLSDHDCCSERADGDGQEGNILGGRETKEGGPTFGLLGSSRAAALLRKSWSMCHK